MMRYAEAAYFPYLSGALIESLSVIVYCVLAGFIVLVAYRFFDAKVEHFQLEMDRLSLAFIEGVTSATETLADYSYQSAPGVRCDDSRITGKLRAPARSNDWNIICVDLRAACRRVAPECQFPGKPGRLRCQRQPYTGQSGRV
jgi:hypothetical protein